jgi:hypothetical protein
MPEKHTATTVNVLARHFRDYFIASLSCNNTNRLGGRTVPVIHDPQKKEPRLPSGALRLGGPPGGIGGALI